MNNIKNQSEHVRGVILATGFTAHASTWTHALQQLSSTDFLTTEDENERNEVLGVLLKCAGSLTSFARLQQCAVLVVAIPVLIKVFSLHQECVVERVHEAKMSVDETREQCLAILSRVEKAVKTVNQAGNAELASACTDALCALYQATREDVSMEAMLQLKASQTFWFSVPCSCTVCNLMSHAVQQLSSLCEATYQLSNAKFAQVCEQVCWQACLYRIALCLLGEDLSPIARENAQNFVDWTTTLEEFPSGGFPSAFDPSTFHAQVSETAKLLDIRGFHGMSIEIKLATDALVHFRTLHDELSSVQRTECLCDIRRTLAAACGPHQIQVDDVSSDSSEHVLENMANNVQSLTSAERCWESAASIFDFAVSVNAESLIAHDRGHEEVLLDMQRNDPVGTPSINLVTPTKNIQEAVFRKEIKGVHWHGPRPERFTTYKLVEEIRSIFIYDFQSKLDDITDLIQLIHSICRSLERPFTFTDISRFTHVVQRMNRRFRKYRASTSSPNSTRMHFYECLQLICLKPIVGLFPASCRAPLAVFAQEELEVHLREQIEIEQALNGGYECHPTNEDPSISKAFVSSTVTSYGSLGPLAFAALMVQETDTSPSERTETASLKDEHRREDNSPAHSDANDSPQAASHRRAPLRTQLRFPFLPERDSNHKPQDASTVASHAFLLFTYHFQGSLRSADEAFDFIAQLWTILRRPLPVGASLFKSRAKAIVARLAWVLNSSMDSKHTPFPLQLWQVMQILCAKPFYPLLPSYAKDGFPDAADAVMAHHFDAIQQEHSEAGNMRIPNSDVSTAQPLPEENTNIGHGRHKPRIIQASLGHTSASQESYHKS